MSKYLLFFIIFWNILQGQSIKIIVKDSLNQNLVQSAFALKENGQFLTKANENGELIFETTEAKILIGAKNYKNIIYDATTNKTNICKLPKKPEELLEVVIRGKQKTIGYGNLNTKYDGSITHLNTAKVENLVCATKVVLTKRSTLAFYNFRVNSKKNNSPFTFQIYTIKDEKPNQVIYNQIIENYKKGWNKVEIQNSNLHLEQGEYFIAMQWIPILDGSNIWECWEHDGVKTFASGQTFCANEGNGVETNEVDCRFFDNKWHLNKNIGKFNHKSFMQNIEVYED
jgi:hypothetical protein